MNKIILITILFISNFALCQNSDYSKIQLGVNCSPSICNATFFNSKLKFGIISGVNFRYNFSNNVGLETGLQFSNKGFSDSYKYSQPNTFDVKQVKNRVQLNYLDLPIKVNFHLGNNKTRFFTSIGFVSNIPLKATSVEIKTFNDKSKTRERYSSKFTNFSLSALVSLGIEIQLVDKLNLQIGPDFRNTLINSPKYQTNALYWTLGLNVGIYKSF